MVRRYTASSISHGPKDLLCPIFLRHSQYLFCSSSFSDGYGDNKEKPDPPTLNSDVLTPTWQTRKESLAMMLLEAEPETREHITSTTPLLHLPSGQTNGRETPCLLALSCQGSPNPQTLRPWERRRALFGRQTFFREPQNKRERTRGKPWKMPSPARRSGDPCHAQHHRIHQAPEKEHRLRRAHAETVGGRKGQITNRAETHNFHLAKTPRGKNKNIIFPVVTDSL